jgi:hypothetical protein
MTTLWHALIAMDMRLCRPQSRSGQGDEDKNLMAVWEALLNVR